MSAASAEGAVQARDVAFRYGDREALRGVSFDVAAGAVHGFLGPNGSGKSTLFKLLATILPLSRGSVSLLGHDLKGALEPIRRSIGVVFQSPALDKKLSIRRNLVYGGQMFGLGGDALQRRVDEMLDYAGLRDRENDSVGDLSGGLRRRVELAKGMLHEPRLLLLDEPTTGLDPAARRDLWEFLRRNEGVTVLFTTHLMDEAELADQLTFLHEGAIVGEGTPSELKASVGGEVLELELGPEVDAEPLAAAIKQGHAADVRVLGSRLRLEVPDAHSLVPTLMRAHGDSIERLSLSRPSLDDVFLARTGRGLGDEGES